MRINMRINMRMRNADDNYLWLPLRPLSVLQTCSVLLNIAQIRLEVCLPLV
jgi:hypothetical protein